jgi:ketosteroid isomerase-like protein
MNGDAKAMQPEDVTRLVAERLNAGDAAGVAALYEPQAVLAYPADRPVTGRKAIQASTSRWPTPACNSRSRPHCPPSGSRTWR